MKLLVVGGGSIGARHLRNLRGLGAGELALVEPAAERRAALSAETGARAFAALSDGLAWAPDVVLIATPSYLHVEQAAAAVDSGAHVFVEKPLSHSEEGLDALVERVAARRVVSLVGCNMRFHPGPATVRRLLAEDAVGRVLFARIHTGSWLPGWRAGSDYRQSYSASAAQGGGCLLDCIHEIDLARWYLGDVVRVSCEIASRSLELDVEDVAMLVLTHADGALSSVHLDYVQRSYERGCQIVGEQGTIFWDFRAGAVRLYDAAAERWATMPQPEGWAVNDMYLDELRHFLDCVRAGTSTTLPVAEGAEVARIALAARRSALTGARVELGRPAWVA